MRAEAKNEAPSRIVVIGASAGGIPALLALAAMLPPDFPAPIVVVQHIGAYPSRLAELLAGRGPNPAVTARDAAVIRAGTIYVAPPDHHVLVGAGTLQLTRGAKENHSRPAIDPLFRTAALAYGRNAIGVILTGMLDDGAAGLRAIKDCGGITVVQDPEEALEPAMPLSAMARTQVDHVSRINRMAGLLSALASQPVETDMAGRPWKLQREQAASMGDNPIENLKAIGHPSVFSCPDCGGVMFELDDEAPARFRCHTGHAFSMLSLTSRQEEVTGDALWVALRAMQEKEMGLRRMAELFPEGRERHQELIAEAKALAEAAATLRKLTTADAY